MNKYPEHEKLQKVKDESQAQGEFLEWLREQGVWLCRMDEDGLLYPTYTRIEDFLAEYHGIDLKVIEQEKREMLEEFREMNS